MDNFVLLKDIKTNMYYSDGCFIEPNKKFADRLRLGQAKSLKQKYERYCCYNVSKYELESI